MRMPTVREIGRWVLLSKPVKTALLSRSLEFALPTVTAFYYNRVSVGKPEVLPELPSEPWTRRLRHDLLSASDGRLRNIEGKGPGLATVSAVIAAADLLAISSGWHESTILGRIVIVLATAYAGFGLIVPLYLVGPLARESIHVREITPALKEADAEEALAVQAGALAMKSDLRNLKLTNLLDAARRELVYALGLVLLWALLVPVTGVLRH